MLTFAQWNGIRKQVCLSASVSPPLTDPENRNVLNFQSFSRYLKSNAMQGFRCALDGTLLLTELIFILKIRATVSSCSFSSLTASCRHLCPCNNHKPPAAAPHDQKWHQTPITRLVLNNHRVLLSSSPVIELGQHGIFNQPSFGHSGHEPFDIHPNHSLHQMESPPSHSRTSTGRMEQVMASPPCGSWQAVRKIRGYLW